MIQEIKTGNTYDAHVCGVQKEIKIVSVGFAKNGTPIISWIARDSAGTTMRSGIRINKLISTNP